MKQLLAVPAAFLALGACSTFVGGPLYEPGKPAGELIVVNNGGFDIDTLTLSRCSAMSHGLDRLDGSTRIAHGTRMRFQMNTGCWDIMVGRAGHCSENSGGRSCSWIQSPSRRFEIREGGTMTIEVGMQGWSN